MTQEGTSIPPSIPDYELLKLVGRGSYGDVWLARGVTGVFRAVKIVWRERFSDPQPFEREFRGLKEFAAVSLTEARQLALLHIGRNEKESFFYYVMEVADDAATGREIDPASYVPNTLREVRTRRGRLPAAEVLNLGVEIARGLAVLHQRNLVHRDIKPSNVIIVGCAPKLADIGLVASASAALTFVGTEGYVPPEGPGAPAADVFSLGKLLYELATGLDRHDYPRLPPDFAALPDRKELLELNEVLIRACEPDARKRHHDATALLDELLLLQAGRSVRRMRTTERRLSRAVRIAAALLIFAGIAGVGAYVEHARAARAEAEIAEITRRTVYSANLAKAQRALERGEYGHARDILSSIKPAPGERDLRGFEWKAAMREAAGDRCEILREAGVPIVSTAFTSDGTLFAVHDEAKTICLYDARSHQLLRKISEVNRFAGFSSDGRWLLGSSKNLALQRWTAADGKLDTTERKDGAFRPLGAQGADRIVAFQYGTDDGRVPPFLVAWDFATQRETCRLPLGESGASPPWKLFRASLSGDGSEALIACVRGSGNSIGFQLSHVRLGEAPSVHNAPAPIRPSALGWLPGPENGLRGWVGDDILGSAMVLNSATNDWHAEPNLPPGTMLAQPVHSAELFAIDGTRVVVHPSESAARSLHGHAGQITALACAPDGTQIVTGSALGELRIWSRPAWTTYENQRQCWNSRTTVSAAIFSADGREIYAPEDSHDVTLLRTADLQSAGRITGMHHPLAATPDGVWGLSADQCSLIHWSQATQHIDQEIGRSASPIAHATFSADLLHVLFVRTSGELVLADLSTQNLTATPRLDEGLRGLILDNSGSRFWATDNNRKIACRTLPSGQPIWSVPTPAIVSDMKMLSSGGSLAIALTNGEVRLLDPTTGHLQSILSSGTAEAQTLTIIPGEQRLLVAGTEGDLHVFDLANGAYIGLVALHPQTSPHWMAAAPDGSAVAVLTKSGMLHMVRTR